MTVWNSFSKGRTFLIAEMSGNHLQSFDHAVRIVEAAAESGADAIKLQTFTADSLTVDSRKEHFMIKGTQWDGQNLYELYKGTAMPWEWQPKLRDVAHKLGLCFFSTAFDAAGVDFLESILAPIQKIASFENVDIPLIKAIARTGKPVLLSTGMASEKEIAEAVRTLRQGGSGEICLLKCTSAYPAPFEEVNLRTMPHLAETYECPVGISDHTIGSEVPVAAVALGAEVIEKHLCLRRDEGGPDSSFSMEPDEFAAMASQVRNVEKALGEISFDLTPKQRESAAYRRSLFVVANMDKGDLFTEDNLRSVRPGHGLHTRYHERLLGTRVTQAVSKGTPLSWEMVAEDMRDSSDGD